MLSCWFSCKTGKKEENDIEKDNFRVKILNKFEIDEEIVKKIFVHMNNNDSYKDIKIIISKYFLECKKWKLDRTETSFTFTVGYTTNDLC